MKVIKQDLTIHSDQELSLIVMNDEWTYKHRRRDWFKDSLEESFLYSDEQFDVLVQDLKDEAKEDGLDVNDFWFGKKA